MTDLQTWQVLLLAAVQGPAELLPVSSSAHVIVAEKLMGLDPTAPAMTLLLVLLHTGTMLAVIVHFWPRWRARWAAGTAERRAELTSLVVASAATAVVGLLLLKLLARLLAPDPAHFEVEQLFGHAPLMAAALLTSGMLIIGSGLLARRQQALHNQTQEQAEQQAEAQPLGLNRAAWIGMVQGLCLPFRGLSRSGATISTALALGVPQRRAEAFSFALAVVLTPAVIAKESWRLLHPHAGTVDSAALWHAAGPGLLGLLAAFGVGLLALRWLSRWLDEGRWHWFGIYCLAAAAVVLGVG